MHNLRFPLKVLSSFLIVLGLLIGIAVAVSAISDARQINSPVDQVDDSNQSSKGFEPMIVPGETFVEPLGAPTLPSQKIGLKEDLPTSSPPLGLSTSLPTIRQTPTSTQVPLPTPTPFPPLIPDRIIIPGIKLDAKVVPANLKQIEVQSKLFQQWEAPNSFAVGHLTSSASLGVAGNTVLIGHHNVYGEVFRYLVNLKVGDLIMVYSGNNEFAYVITLKMILRERDQPLEVRLKNAQWIAPSQDVRLTLITCWPYTNNTHRLILVATPIDPRDITKLMKLPRMTRTIGQ